MHRSFSILAACIAACAAASASAQETLTLTHAGKGIETVSATVEGREGTYLFDSGIGTSGVTPEVATAIGCTPWGKVSGFRATGERLDVPRCNAATIAVASYRVTLPQLSVFDLATFMGDASHGLSGALGLDLFVDRVVTLKIARHEVTVEDDASLAAIRKDAVEVPMRIVRAAEGAALTVDLGVTTRSGIAWMEMDTGNYGPSMVDATIAPLFGLDPKAKGPQPFSAALAKDVAIDDRAIVKPLIMDGNLGRGVLHHWEITLDLKNGRAWIKVLPLNFNEKAESMAKELGKIMQ